MNKEEKTNIIERVTDKAREDATSFEEIAPLFDEYMLRWYVYGNLEERTPCQIYELVSAGRTSRKKFPVKFLTVLIEHLVKCEVCHSKYVQSSGGRANES